MPIKMDLKHLNILSIGLSLPSKGKEIAYNDYDRD